jgi:transcription-repair coupling factor (superfamily II helicase)
LISANRRKTIELHIPALIPEDYLPDVHQRLILYKRIASAPDTDALSELQVEMIDRFGLLPQPVKNLFEISSIRNIAKQAGVLKIDLGDHGGYILFSDAPKIDTGIVIELIQTKSHVYRLDGNNKLRINYQSETEHGRITFILELLGRLMNKQETASDFA